MTAQRLNTQKLFSPGALARWCALGLFSTAIVASAQSENPVPATAVSAASYRAVVAPDSLATVFGSQLATKLVQATLDANGQLPRELDGTSIEVNGKRAPLVFVSPNQVNFLVPADTDIGSGQITVRSTGTGVVSVGTVPIRTVAPALFALNASGRGRGAIINAITFELDPFGVQTPNNPGSDKKTRLSIYGTGLRFAGNPERNTATVNVASSVRMEGRDGTGKLWPLTVEYAGPAPGYFGLDQLNVVLPPELDGIGVLSLTAYVESAVSNQVTVTIRNSRGPLVAFLSQQSVPPGAEILISGDGFTTSADAGGGSRLRVLFSAGSGPQVPTSPLDVTSNSLRVCVPPISKPGSTDWYEGPVTVCVELDNQRNCAPQALILQPAARPSKPVGETVAEIASDLAKNAAEELTALGKGDLAQQMQADSKNLIDDFRAMVKEAVEGHPRTITFENIDGQTHTVTFDLAYVQKVESLLAANQQGALSSIAEAVGSQRWKSRAAATDPCLSDQEKKLQDAKESYQSAKRAMKIIAWGGLGATLGTDLIACIAVPPACPEVLMYSLPVAGIGLAAASYGPFYKRLVVETGTNFLEDLTPQPSTVSVSPGATLPLTVTGTFVNTATAKVISEVILKFSLDLLSAILPATEAQTTAGQVVEQVGSALGKVLVKQWANNAFPPFPGSKSVQVPLGRGSLSATPFPGADTYANVLLGCGSQAGSVQGKDSTNGKHVTFRLSASADKLLLLDPNRQPLTPDGAPLETVLNVSVGNPPVPALQTDRASYQAGDIVKVTGAGFPPRAPVRTTWTDPQNRQLVFDNQTDDLSKFGFYVPLSASAAAGTYRLTSSVAGTSLAASTQFSVVAAPGVTLLSLTISPATVVGGETTTGTVTLSGPAPTGGALVSLRSNSAAAQVPASVTVAAGRTSAPFSITTTTVSTAQEIQITASLAGISRTATLTVRPLPQPGVPTYYTISTYAGTGQGGHRGDGGPATAAQLSGPAGVAVDSVGNLYVADSDRIRKVSADGVISTTAGGGTSNAEGIPALSARLDRPWAVAVDQEGNLYVALGDHKVKRVSRDGIVTTVAGTGVKGFSGDAGPATAAQLSSPKGVALDSAGNVFIADNENHRVRRVSRSGVITTVAGTGTLGRAGDGGPATAAELSYPYSLTMDRSGNLYIGCIGDVRKVTPGGTITTVAGTGSTGFSGDGGSAKSARISIAHGIALDAQGTLYFADPVEDRIRRVTPDGLINTIAGTGVNGFSGDGGPATAAQLSFPAGVAVDPLGQVYVGDFVNDRVRKLTPQYGTPPVSPLSLLTLTLSSSTVTAGATVTGTVTLSAATPAGGIVVALQSNNAGAQVPASVTVASGQTSATFTIRTTTVASAESATITATYAGVSRTATLTINPATQSSFHGERVIIEGSFVYDKTSFPVQIDLQPFVGYYGESSHLAIIYCDSGTFGFAVLFDFATFVGTTITFNKLGTGSFWALPGGAETIGSAEMSLTAAAAALGSSVTGNLKFSTLKRTIEGPISGAIASIQ